MDLSSKTRNITTIFQTRIDYNLFTRNISCFIYYAPMNSFSNNTPEFIHHFVDSINECSNFSRILPLTVAEREICRNLENSIEEESKLSTFDLSQFIWISVSNNIWENQFVVSLNIKYFHKFSIPSMNTKSAEILRDWLRFLVIHSIIEDKMKEASVPRSIHHIYTNHLNLISNRIKIQIQFSSSTSNYLSTAIPPILFNLFFFLRSQNLMPVNYQ